MDERYEEGVLGDICRAELGDIHEAPEYICQLVFVLGSFHGRWPFELAEREKKKKKERLLDSKLHGAFALLPKVYLLDVIETSRSFSFRRSACCQRRLCLCVSPAALS